MEDEQLGTRPDRLDVRADVWRLVELCGLIAWADPDNGKCGIRYGSDEHRDATAHEGTALHYLAGLLGRAGKWAHNPDGEDEDAAHPDAMDLAPTAVNIATHASTETRRVLGEIIHHTGLRYGHPEVFSFDPIAVFDAWAAEVRSVGMRLTATFRPRHYWTAPWE